jgi:hypothetical protein
VGGDEGAIKVSETFSYLVGSPIYLSATVRRIDHFILVSELKECKFVGGWYELTERLLVEGSWKEGI